MPAYIPYPGAQEAPPPYFFPEVSLLSCVLMADPLRLAEFCDKYLAVDRRRVFTPVGPYVVLGINQYPRMVSEHDGSKGEGFTSQNEYFLMFPAMRSDNLNGFMVPREVTWVFPFIGVDNPGSAFTGREMLGFPKTVGAIAVDADTQGQVVATVSMPGFKTNSPSTPQELLPLITIRTGPPLQVTIPTVHNFPWDVLTNGLPIDGFEDTAASLMDDVDPGSYSVTNLKQFCDPTNPTEAVFQALVRAVWRQENTGPATFYDGVEVEVVDNAVVQIAAELGLDVDASGKITPLSTVALTTDMRFGEVTNLFVSS